VEAPGALSGVRAVLDASALIAAMRDEPGGELARAAIAEGAAISAVNWAEVVAKARSGTSPESLQASAESAGVRIVAFDSSQANTAAKLKSRTQTLGLSLADRACLALAGSLDVPALTADRAWSEVEADVAVRVIR
jgi:PIN domain nuclease of toxin-antitoxin system